MFMFVYIEVTQEITTGIIPLEAGCINPTKKASQYEQLDSGEFGSPGT